MEIDALEARLTSTVPTCPVCRTGVEPSFLVCPVCTARLKEPCASCAAPLEPLWQTCPYCATAVATEDLDTALTAEARLQTAVQPRVRAAD